MQTAVFTTSSSVSHFVVIELSRIRQQEKVWFPAGSQGWELGLMPTGQLMSGRDIADDNSMDLSAIALQGLQRADVQLEAAAANLAKAGANSAGSSLDTVDLATQIVALNSAQDIFAVNLVTLKTADQVQQTVLNLLA